MPKEKFMWYPKILKEFMFLTKKESLSSHSGQRVPAMANLKILTVLLPVITETTWRFL